MPFTENTDTCYLDEQGDTATFSSGAPWYTAPYTVDITEHQQVVDPIPIVRFLNFWSSSRYDEPANLRPAQVITTEQQDPATAGANVLGRKASVFHYQDSHAAFTVDVDLGVPVPAGQTRTIAYTTGGSAISGTHYSITAGTSPITFSAGEQTKQITIDPLATGDYHIERLLTLTLDADNSNAPLLDPLGTTVAFSDSSNLLQVWIRTTTNAPVIDFNVASSTPAPGALASMTVDVAAGDVGTHEDALAIHAVADATSTAVEGVDYDWVDDPQGGASIAAAGSSGTLRLQLRPGAVAGRTVVVNLRHELDDQSQENLASCSPDWRSTVTYDAIGEENKNYSSTPAVELHSTTNFGDRSNMSLGPGPALPGHNPFNNPIPTDEPLLITKSTNVNDPWGDPAIHVKVSPGANMPGYIRCDAIGKQHGGRDDIVSQVRLANYSRFSIFVTLEPGVTAPRFIRLGQRERGFQFDTPQTINNGQGFDYHVVFDRESPTTLTSVAAVTKANASTSYVAHATGNWSVWSDRRLTSDSGANHNFGITPEDVRFPDGTVRSLLRIWFLIHVDNATLTSPGNATTLLQNPIWWSNQDGGANIGQGWTEHAATNSTAGVDGGLAAHLNEGLNLFWPRWEHGAAVLTGAPAAAAANWFPRQGIFWEPVGNAVLAAAGTNTHTITIT